MAACAPSRRSRTSLTTATFSGLGFSIVAPLLGWCRLMHLLAVTAATEQGPKRSCRAVPGRHLLGRALGPLQRREAQPEVYGNGMCRVGDRLGIADEELTPPRRPAPPG